MPVRAAGRSKIALAAVAALCTAVLGHPEGTGARFTNVASVGANTFTTASCLRAAIKGVQSGTATNAVNGTTTVAISSVDATRSFLVFQTRHNSNRPVGSTLRGRIASATSLEFVRVTDEGTPGTITIRWYVVEYACGVRVQRGSLTGVNSPATVAITPVKSTAQAFALVSKTALAADTNFDNNEAVIARLTSTSTLEITSDGGISSHVIWWEVVEFLNSADVRVQTGRTSLTGTALSTTATIPTAVDPAKTFLLVGFTTSGTGADIGSRMLRAELTSATTITFERQASGSPDPLTDIAWQAVELTDGSRVQRGTSTVGSGTTQVTASLTPIHTGRAAAFSSVHSGGGQNMGMSPYTGDDIVGVGAFTASLTGTQITLARDSTAAASTVSWFVVEWGQPPWWSTAYSYRREITITAGTAGTAPAGYSVSVTFDHAALVAAGKAQAGGGDLRVAYWNGSAWVELDRVLDAGSAWNSATTRIVLKTQAAIAAGGVDRNYYLHYGNSTATSPPASMAGVYLAYDDFGGGTVGQAPPGWTVQAGGPWQVASDIGNNIVRRLSTGGSTGRQYLRINGVSETDVLVQARVRTTAGPSEDLICVAMRGAGTGASDISVYRMCLQENAGRKHQRGKFVSGTFTEIGATAYSWADGTWYTVAGAVYGSTLKQWIDGTLVATNTDTSLTGAGSVGLLAFVGSQIDYDFDDFLVRRYVDPEPTSAVGAETT